MPNVRTTYAFWKKWCETAQSMTRLHPDDEQDRFTNALVNEVFLVVGKHCKLGAPKLIDRDIIAKIDFGTFFVTGETEKACSAAESLANLPEIVFTLEGS